VLLGIDRIPDMARTATNVAGILTAAVVMDRLLGGSNAIPTSR
jgi:Na+/H+-dicarboxylate symporter